MRSVRIAVVLCLLVALPASARFQRMAVARGTYRIAPKTASRVPAYCVDLTRQAPHREVTLNQLLAGADRARVVTPTRRLSLAEALAEGLLSVSGENFSFERDLFNDPVFRRALSRATADERAQFDALMEAWRSLTPKEKAELEAEWSRMFGGSSSSIRFVNHGKEEVRLEFGDEVLTSAEPEAPVALPARLSAKNIWDTRTREQQTMLRELGYYEGKIDGDFGPKTEKAVTDLQEANGLEKTGSLDPITEARLVDHYRMHAINRANTQAEAAIIAREKDLSYRLTTASGTRVHDTLEAVVKDLFSEMRVESLQPLYVDAVGFKAGEVDGLVTGLRLQLPSESGVRIHAIPRAGPAATSHDLILGHARLIRVDRVSNAPEATLRLEGELHGRKQSFVVRVVAKIAEWLDYALTRLTALLTGEKRLTFADAAETVRSELRARYPEMTDDDFHIFLMEQATAIEVVDILVSRDAA